MVVSVRLDPFGGLFVLLVFNINCVVLGGYSYQR